ncbi:hypothetical protein [Palleronia abyssalis]|uniref:Transmembrane protein n=1 Tax=Palleronia abyssalis TaxID=1501240 RepID=A0A2R8BTH2_9RHOB|nr:hypothetical protein [Palleronia abyssalis]SPJ23451.1 hypothetical protein PAA8504_01262 [Palleronia abyssalis]
MAGHMKTDLPAHRNIFRMIAAPTVWAIHFLLVYCTAALWCARDWGSIGALQAVIFGYTAVCLILVGILGWQMWRQWDYFDDNDYIHDQSTDEHRREFLGHAGFMLACLSFVAIIFDTMPAIFAATCQ